MNLLEVMAERHVLHPRLGVVRALLRLQDRVMFSWLAEVLKHLLDGSANNLPALLAGVPRGGPAQADGNEVRYGDSVVGLRDAIKQLGVVAELIVTEEPLQRVPGHQ